MKCCGNIVFGIRAPLQSGQIVLLKTVLESRVSKRPGFCAFFNAAERLSAARTTGGRPNYTKLSSWVCISSRTEGFSSKSSRSGGTCFPHVSESCFYHRTRRECLMMMRAEKDEHGTEEKSEDSNKETPEVANIGPPVTIKKSAFLTSDFFLQVAIFVLAAGFVDAGFSGDWSRIGVLSKHTEEELQMAAIGVVPLAATLIWSISKRNKNL